MDEFDKEENIHDSQGSHSAEIGDAELVQRACADDKQAFNELMERYQTMALYLALRLVRDEETARELVQEAMLQAFLSLHHLRDSSRFKSWFYGIVLNVCRSWRREQKHTIFSLDALNTQQAETIPVTSFLSLRSDSLVDPLEVAEQREIDTLLRQSLDILSPQNRMVALLFYYEDLSLQEIMTRLQLTLPAVKNRLLKIREQLRHHLQVLYPEIQVATTHKHKQRKAKMIQVQPVRMLQKRHRALLVLLDEAHQRILPLWLANWEYQPNTLVQQLETSNDRNSNAIEPLTIDLMMNLLEATEAILEKVTIEVLREELLYAILHVRSQGNSSSVRKIKARLNDALPLALRAKSLLYVADEILDRKSVPVQVTPGKTFDQYLDQVVHELEVTIYTSTNQFATLRTVPRSIDFTHGLQGWSFIGFPREPEYSSYRLDHDKTRNGKPSLALTLKNAQPLSMISLHYDGFQAESYLGKRLRMSVYVLTEDVKNAAFTLEVRNMRSVHNEQVPMTLVGTTTEPLSGTHDWLRQDLVIDIPGDADLITCHFHMTGQGKVWFNEIIFEEVDDSVPTTELTNLGPQPDEPQNTHFTHKLTHWKLTGSYPQDYERGIDYAAKADATPAGYLKSSVSSPRGNAQMQQRIRGRNYEGKDVRLVCNVKTAGVEQQAALYLKVDGVHINEVREKSIQDVTEWEEREVRMHIPNGGLSLVFGIMLYGRGQVWLDDLRLEVVSEGEN
jgi:RNA polymerase sigma factor (sigma-70 family)